MYMRAPRTCCLCVVWHKPRETHRANPLGLHGTTGLLARCFLGAISSDASAVGRTRGQRLAQRWAENPPLPFLLRLPPESLATMLAPTTGTHGLAGSQSTPSRSMCSAVLHSRAERFLGAEHQAPQEKSETHEAREVARPRSVVPELQTGHVTFNSAYSTWRRRAH